MRFFENGPNVPSHLIEQQALGNVIFFCGAGVSRQAGLPDFGGLATKIVSKLRAEKAKKALDAMETLDRVFNALIGEFGSQEIDRQIYQALKTPRQPKLSHHRTILDLSRDLQSNAQVVTTNFDLLFEKVDRYVKRFVPPSLPDISLGEPAQGIIYLHGRLAKPDFQTKAGYIISSADFGRAYLAEGWAARFVRALRENYTIILIGYSANDPPMRYLLEGLHNREQARYASPIYTFSSGEMEEEWRDKGVTAIAYEPLDSSHSGLWDTLSAWAAVSNDPEGRNRRIIALAQQRPSELKPYERGQVANFVSNSAGAKLFANATPSPPADWLCVLDPNVRYSKPSRDPFEEDVGQMDPLVLFGLDDDLPRPTLKPGESVALDKINYLSWMFGDTIFPETSRLAGGNPAWLSRLPERLYCLSHWFGRVCHEPTAVWWASGFQSLHPGLSWFIRRRLQDGGDLRGPNYKFWELYLEASDTIKLDMEGSEWFHLQKIIKRGGWSPYAFRVLQRISEPRVTFARRASGPPNQAASDWEQLTLSEIVEMNVHVLDLHSSKELVPDDHLPKVVEIVRRGLFRVADLLSEVETLWWQAPTLHPEDSGEIYYGQKEKFFLWFVALFKRLKALDPTTAKLELSCWNRNEPFFFGKLYIFAQMDADLASSREAAVALATISDQVFWNEYNRRELLFTLRARWGGLTLLERRTLERRIIRGMPRRPGLPAAEHRRRKGSTAASILRWLQLNSCDLTPATVAILPKLKSADQRWTDEWARVADDSLGVKGGFIETITELRGLDEIPVNKIIEAAERQTEDKFGELRHFRPFEGFVKTFPFAALSALRFEAKRSNYPVRFWQNVLSEWPDDTPQRLRWLLGHTLAALPEHLALELRHYLPNWLKKHLKALAQQDHVKALSIFDRVVAPYMSAISEVTESGIGTTTIGGVIKEQSEVSYTKAINSPCGVLTECLFSLRQDGLQSKLFPKFLSKRLAILFALPGNGGGHAVCIATARMGWLDHYYRAWVKHTLVPFFSLASPRSEAAWHGLAFDQNLLSAETRKMLNQDFLKLLAGHAKWKLNENEYHRLIQLLILLSRKVGRARAIVSFAQAQAALKALNHKGRAEALTMLSSLIATEGEWTRFIKPFVEQAWPRQIKYRSEETSRAFVTLLAATGKNFPEAVDMIRPFLIQIPHLDMITYQLVKENGGEESDLANAFPEAALSLLDTLIGGDRSSCPYQIPKILEIIAEAAPALRRSRAWCRLHNLSS